MILSPEEKYRFSQSMSFFVELLNKDLKSICKSCSSLELVLLSYAIEVEGELIYFDYPYNSNNKSVIDLINKSLEDEKSKYYQIDDYIYQLLENSTSTTKYLIYEIAESPNLFRASKNIKSSLPFNTVENNLSQLKQFLPVMYYSAFPEKLSASNYESFDVIFDEENLNGQYFIVFHNENIEDKNNKIISNYCLIGNSDDVDLNAIPLEIIYERLKTFSTYFGSKEHNIVIKKNVELSDVALSINVEIYHHIKELIINLTLLPVQGLREHLPQSSQLKIAERNIKRVHEFFENHVSFLKSNIVAHREVMSFTDYFQSTSFQHFISDLKAANDGIEFIFNIDSSLKAIVIISLFDIVVKELILNGIKSQKQQNVYPKKILLSVTEAGATAAVVISSLGTCYEKKIFMPLEYLGLKLMQSSSISGECGVGLYLVNKMLMKLNADGYHTKLGYKYFEATENFNELKGVTIKFNLPKK